MSTARWRGLYALTDGVPRAPEDLASLVEAAIRGGAVLIQYRDKGTDDRRRRAEAATLVTVCHAHGVPLLVNDDVALALAVGADGAHLGRDDLPLAAARRQLGPRAILGVSCYADPERALAAQAEGASYVAFGRFFPSLTKPGASPANLEMLARVRPRLHLPVVAIGGVTPENGPVLITAGADLLAVVHGIFGEPDPRTAAERYARLFPPVS